MSERRTRRFWTDADHAVLIARYPHEKSENIARDLGRSLSQIYNRAYAFDLKKSPEYLASKDACRLRKGDQVGAEFRFGAGHKTWNKGMKGLQIGGEATQFGKGHKPANHQPVGTTRIVDGYIEIKVAEGMRQWKAMQRVVWERENGPIPTGASIIFKDGNRQNCAIENLEMLTRAQLMQKNTRHNYPKEINEVIAIRAAITRQINKRSKDDGKQH